ncbi:hypothetical protein GCM10023094_39140 [Rhodococcus olei]|uniref:Putative membrane protein insertion efficiency factor n=1 Tax=Rhodococcus olei TaxID=2161675 RepID=A0ABP8PDR0_9NOCA
MTTGSDTPSGLLAAVRRVPARTLIFCIELYRTYVSPTRMPTCRFAPTCSEYAVDALRERGAVVGLGLTVVRLLKCGPWHPGGWDPVPPRGSRRRRSRNAAQDTGKQPHAPVGVGEQRST